MTVAFWKYRGWPLQPYSPWRLCGERMGLSCIQYLVHCQTHISICVHVDRIKLVIHCWQSVSIRYTAHQRPLSVQDLKQIMSFCTYWEKKIWSYFGLLHVVVDKYSNVSKEGIASIFRITELISIDTTVIRRETFVGGVELFVVRVVSLVTCKEEGKWASFSVRCCLMSDLFNGTQTSLFVLIINIFTRLI